MFGLRIPDLIGKFRRAVHPCADDDRFTAVVCAPEDAGQLPHRLLTYAGHLASTQRAGGCGRLLAAPSTVRPVLRYCGAGAHAEQSHAASTPSAREESVGSAIRRYLGGVSADVAGAGRRGSKAKRSKMQRPKCLDH